MNFPLPFLLPLEQAMTFSKVLHFSIATTKPNIYMKLYVCLCVLFIIVFVVVCFVVIVISVCL